MSKKHKQSEIPIGQHWMRKKKKAKEFQKKRIEQINNNEFERLYRMLK